MLISHEEEVNVMLKFMKKSLKVKIHLKGGIWEGRKKFECENGHFSCWLNSYGSGCLGLALKGLTT